MRVAVLSDTHGNLTAFEAVLADIDARGIERILHLGDLAGKGPRGNACCDLTRARCEATVLGNWDVFLLSTEAEYRPEEWNWWRDELSPENREWLSKLPFSVDLELAGTPIRCFHASADDVFHRIYRDVSGDEWDELFQNNDVTGQANPEPKVAIYGDIHDAYARTEGEHTLLNCGAVGNPMDEPTASYIVLDDSTGELRWEFVRVPYDIEAELAVAREMGMPAYESWESELRTAQYAR
jgi:protein phosphatase